MKSHRYFLILLFIWLQIICYSQELTYDILWKGDTIGTLVAQQYDSASFAIYSIESDVSIWMLGRKNLKNTSKSTYDGNDLINTQACYYKNDVLKETNRTQLTDNMYLVHHLEKKREDEVDSPHSYSICRLYFDEPKALDQVYSERHCKLLQLKRKGSNSYELTKPDGRLNTYTFEEGICQEVKVETFWATIYFVRRAS